MKPYIPQPCHEDWNAMTEKDKGRHCDVCSKVVVDFTKMSDAEMIDYLQQHSKQKTCGHFRNDQLYQTEKLEINLASIPTNLSFRKYFAIALLITFTSFGLVSCKSNTGRTVGEIEVVDSTHTLKQDSLPTLTGAVAQLPPKEFVEGEICIKPSDSVKSNQESKKIKEVQPTIVGEIEAKPILENQKTQGIIAAPKEK